MVGPRGPAQGHVHQLRGALRGVCPSGLRALDLDAVPCPRALRPLQRLQRHPREQLHRRRHAAGQRPGHRPRQTLLCCWCRYRCRPCSRGRACRHRRRGPADCWLLPGLRQPRLHALCAPRVSAGGRAGPAEWKLQGWRQCLFAEGLCGADGKIAWAALVRRRLHLGPDGPGRVRLRASPLGARGPGLGRARPGKVPLRLRPHHDGRAEPAAAHAAEGHARPRACAGAAVPAGPGRQARRLRLCAARGLGLRGLHGHNRGLVPQPRAEEPLQPLGRQGPAGPPRRGHLCGRHGGAGPGLAAWLQRLCGVIAQWAAVEHPPPA
mmetsp:Transcript_86079/g.251848  ORF Transcript_86079/g.251848 Transcript_86079/m.251848 type:complete len:322 (-) Transcript_86079:93-1058(-)